jgi:Carboxypeptidase regulatory-like domain/TonB-dependent Receptor Plug Domain
LSLRRITRLVFLLVCASAPFVMPLVAPFSAHAQVNTASLGGLVADQTNAALVHAHVTATNSATGLVRETDTDNAGYYSFPDLPIGEYRVVVSLQNFETVEARVTVGTAERVRRDLVLKVGTAQANVEVNDVINNLSPDDASIGTVIDNQTIQDTPLYLRNWDDLLRMVAGVQIARYTQQSGATSAGRVGDFNVHGVHSLQNNFLLDGIDNNTISENVQELSTESAHPSVDTIQEFNVVTNPYSAEYGRSPGAAVSISTKGGSNAFHGLAYEYLRNAAFDANDFISNQHNLSKPENNQNQFGGNFGGPILKNKLFGFFNYEGTRIKQGVSRVSTVPLPNERVGDFSPETAASLGLPAYPTIYDPTTGQPFPDNKIPAGRIDTAVSGLMNLFPQPNASGDLNNFVRNALAQDNDDSYDGRIDYTLNSSNTFFGRYSYSNRFRFIPGFLGGIADGTSTSAWGRQFLKSYSFVLGYTHIFTPTLVNDFHLGFIRNFSYAEQDPFGQNAADQFVPGIPNNPAIAGGVPLTTFSNFGFIGSPDFLPKRQIPQQYQYSDTISWTHGAHSFKFGGTLWAPMRNIFQDEPGTRGDLGFTGVFTTCVAGAGVTCPSKSGLSYADGLLGLTQSTQLTNVFFVDQRLWMLAGFAEDDWKVTRKLTVNLGLRYDFATPALEGNNQTGEFRSHRGGLACVREGWLAGRSVTRAGEQEKLRPAPRVCVFA